MSARMHTDWPMLMAILLILAFGLVMVVSASSTVPKMLNHMAQWEPERSWDLAKKQFVAAIIGLIALFAIRWFGYLRLQHPLYVFLPVNLVAIALIGVALIDPKHRWYHIFGIQLQPSELAKPILILFVAWFVARREDKLNDRYTFLPVLLVVGGLSALIAYGDLGTALVILVPAAAVFYVAGIDRKYFRFTILIGFLLFAGFLIHKPYRIIRLTSFIGLTEERIQTDPRLHWLARLLERTGAERDAGYHALQAKLAVGSGGALGVGLGQSKQKLGFLPEPHTDFILGVIGEEWGLAGCIVLLGAYFLIFWRGLRLYWLAPDPFGRYLALGCVALFTAQAFFNMSVVLGLAPTKGLPLPLISYGGSSVFCMLLTLGLLMSVGDRATAT